mmetsp:Transcript_57510/g.132559  ORF Transcript_57510/g.132559 Transcript_57510/m.132559 type:complete len:267 (-) Transcript_57510:144-944(-)
MNAAALPLLGQQLPTLNEGCKHPKPIKDSTFPEFSIGISIYLNVQSSPAGHDNKRGQHGHHDEWCGWHLPLIQGAEGNPSGRSREPGRHHFLQGVPLGEDGLAGVGAGEGRQREPAHQERQGRAHRCKVKLWVPVGSTPDVGEEREGGAVHERQERAVREVRPAGGAHLLHVQACLPAELGLQHFDIFQLLVIVFHHAGPLLLLVLPNHALDLLDLRQVLVDAADALHARAFLRVQRLQVQLQLAQVVLLHLQPSDAHLVAWLYQF